MGLQSLQDFINSDISYHTPLTKYLEGTKVEGSNLVLVHADSCIKHFYHENMDWICGGQWSELYQCVEKFVKSFRNTDLELIVFFDGSNNDLNFYQWLLKQKQSLEVVKETLSHLVHTQKSGQFRIRSKDFVAPGAYKAALRLAFRACEVTVCSSIQDIYKESILYAKDEKCLGILGNDSHYFLYNFPRYLTFGNIKWLKKALNAFKVFNQEEILNKLNLTVDDLPYLGALLGNFVITDHMLSSFYWDIIEDDSPLKKIKDNLTSQEAALPPNEVRLKCVAKFISKKRSEIEDFENLSKLVFGNSTSISVADGKQKLEKVINFYKDALKAAKSVICIDKDEVNQLTKSGFPVPTTTSDISGSKIRYKKNWTYVAKRKKPLKTENSVKDKHEEETQSDGKSFEDPETVLKQGTLEEAAQALELLELEETAAHLSSDEKNELPVCNNEQEEEKPAVRVEAEEKTSNMTSETNENNEHQNLPVIQYSREIIITPIHPDISNEVLAIARKRHQNGQMSPEILKLLTKGELFLNLTIDNDDASSCNPIPLIYRPMRQLMYGVLFGAKQIVTTDESSEKAGATKDDADGMITDEQTDKTPEKQSVCIKEWCVCNEKGFDRPVVVKPRGMSWGVPSLKQLWFGTNSEDNANRLKAFLSCMKSDTINMSNTSMVPQRLMLLCCVLRYLVQHEEKNLVLTKQDIDAFLAQALSSHLTTEHNVQNLANMKLNQVNARCIQLASIFMNGVENAIMANDACGSPVPWEFCCPWNFFDGKLFHTKWLQATMNFSTIDLCEGKSHLAEKLERLRWCITEGLEAKYTIAGLKAGTEFVNSFGSVQASAQTRPMYGVMRPDGNFSPAVSNRVRSRGSNSKRAVHGSGGTLHVAGVPVAHWGGNKAGVGYSKNGPSMVVGGVNSIDLPSSHRHRGRGGRGRGLLETPFISPWQQGFGYEFINSTYDRYLKGVQKVDQVRSKLGKPTKPLIYTNSNIQQQYKSSQQQAPRQQKPKHKQGGCSTNTSTTNSLWLGRGRGQEPTKVLPAKAMSNQGYGRGLWLNTSE